MGKWNPIKPNQKLVINLLNIKTVKMNLKMIKEKKKVKKEEKKLLEKNKQLHKIIKIK